MPRPQRVPVCTDATPERDADVPDSFLAVQWTRLTDGETSSAFVERVQRLLAGEVSGRSSGDAVPAGASAARPRAPRVPYAAVAVAVILALAYLAYERLAGPKPPVSETASIAVLPLANESGDADQRYFSEGISEDLITALGQFPELEVIGRSSAFKFRDSKEDSRSIGAQLGVAQLRVPCARRPALPGSVMPAKVS